MNVKESLYDEQDWFYDDEDLEKREEVINSDLSILRIWVSLFENNGLVIKPRADNIFYSNKCPYHKASDYPVCIDEKLNGYFCYGCGRGGSILTLISEYFKISIEDALKILFAYINNDIKSLDEEELQVLERIFNNYNSAKTEEYLSISSEKTKYLNQRIDRYIECNGYSQDNVKKMKKRLCCTPSYIRKRYYDTQNK